VKLLEPLARALQEATKDIDNLAIDLQRKGFRRNAIGHAKTIYDTMTAAAQAVRNSGNPHTPYIAVRNLALELHNDHQETEAAYTIADGLDLAVPDDATDLKSQISEDKRTLQRELKIKALATAVANKNIEQGIQIANELITLANTDEERQFAQNMRDGLQQRRAQSTRRWLVAAGVVIVIGFFALKDQFDKGQRTAQLSAVNARQLADHLDIAQLSAAFHLARPLGAR
jgi:hypothetical protein